MKGEELVIRSVQLQLRVANYRRYPWLLMVGGQAARKDSMDPWARLGICVQQWAWGPSGFGGFAVGEVPPLPATGRAWIGSPQVPRESKARTLLAAQANPSRPSSTYGSNAAVICNLTCLVPVPQ